MLLNGDFDGLQNVLDWASGLLPLLSNRSQLLLPEHSTGIYTTETVTGFGLFQQGEYQCGQRPAGYPVWLENSGWVQLDFGGNALGPEAGLMAVDYYAWTNDLAAAAKYVPIATKTLDFYAAHYPNRSADGKMVIWPTQVLETWWCAWPGWEDCCENDQPQVAALHALTARVLAIPEASGLLTPAQRATYAALQAILPPLPVDPDGTYAAAAVLSASTHNSEGPWLYATHPFRLNTVGTATVGTAPNLTAAVATWLKQGWMHGGDGWSYGGINAALLGLAEQAAADASSRAAIAPADGYRYPVFAPHLQDYEPSADHYANMLTEVNYMLLQTGEDGFGAGTIVLLPAWPCENDVSFRLHAAQATTVEVVYTGGKLVSLSVTPPARAGAVKWAACVSAEDAAAAQERLLSAL